MIVFCFFKATSNEARVIKLLLNEYGNSSGQVVNYQKSGIFFSANVRRDKQQEIKKVLEVHNELRNSKYLGLPSLVGRSKKAVFNFVKERVWRKVQSWSNKLLSKAGKTVLIKNVAQTVPSYLFSCFLLPKTLCSEMERLMNGYWWGSGMIIRKVLSGYHGRKWLLLEVEEAWGFVICMVLMWRCWGNLYGIFVRNQTLLWLVCLKPDTS